MKYNRFYSFGCSYTNFIWPTWAHIIADDLGIPFENWGMSGLGNQAIQSRLVECDFRNNLTSDDLVIVAWSSWSREDRYINDYWHSGGNIFNNNLYDADFIKKYWSWENDVIKNSTAIHMTNKAYKDIIKYQMSMLPSFEKNMNIMDWLLKTVGKTPNLSVESFYKNKLIMPPIIDVGGNSKFNDNCGDNHPDIKSHLYIVENQIYPKLGLSLNPLTRFKYIDMFTRISKLLSKEDGIDMITKKVNRVLVDMNLDLTRYTTRYGF